jgi:hypothetical protein
MSKFLKYNNSTIYSNTLEDKDIVYEHLRKRLSLVDLVSDSVVGQKNLVYFTVSGDDSYICLLEMCLKSIIKFTPDINFDILFITQENFVDKIRAISCLSNFLAYYHIVESPEDGIAASAQKIQIFKYKNINEYKKILYIDCDIVCVKPICELFNIEFDPKYIQVASNPTVKLDAWDTNVVFFGLGYLKPEHKKYIETSQVTPFNAGQFMFYNTERMRAHFENIIWLMSVWPGPYFFEQSFMNFYFGLHGLTKKDVLSPRASLISVGTFTEARGVGSVYDRKFVEVNGKKILQVREKLNTVYGSSFFEEYKIENYHLIHFIGMTLDGTKKLEFAKKFLELKNICL